MALAWISAAGGSVGLGSPLHSWAHMGPSAACATAPPTAPPGSEPAPSPTHTWVLARPPGSPLTSTSLLLLRPLPLRARSTGAAAAKSGSDTVRLPRPPEVHSRYVPPGAHGARGEERQLWASLSPRCPRRGPCSREVLALLPRDLGGGPRHAWAWDPR